MKKFSREEFQKIIQKYTYNDAMDIIPLDLVSQRGIVYHFDDEVQDIEGNYLSGRRNRKNGRIRAYLGKTFSERETHQDILLWLFDKKFLPRYGTPKGQN